MALVQSLPDFELLSYDDNPTAPSLTLKHSASWTHCGPILPENYDELPASFHTWAKASVCGGLAPSLEFTLRHMNAFFTDAGIESYWLTIRATKGSNDFDMPRWHTDDEFFRFPDATQGYPKSKAQWKLAATLLGPGTLFVEDSLMARSYNVRRELRAKRKLDSMHVYRYVAWDVQTWQILSEGSLPKPSRERVLYRLLRSNAASSELAQRRAQVYQTRT